MTPKELLDTMLGYLGFVVEIAEMQGEGENLTLQIYTEESRRLIGRNGEMLEAIQFLLNRLLQAKDKDAPKVIVDCEHYRSMIWRIASKTSFAAPIHASRMCSCTSNRQGRGD